MGTAVQSSGGLTAEQLQRRLKGIGASEVAAVLGLDRYKSPLDVWLEKTGRRAVDWAPPSQAAKMGHLLEPVVAELAHDHYKAIPLHVILEPSDTLVGAEPWMLATPDRFVHDHTDSRYTIAPRDSWLLECKTKSWNTFKRFGEPGTDQVPDEIVCQTLWQLAVTGKDRCDIAVLVDGREFYLYRIDRNQPLIDDVVERVGAWWHSYVLKDEEPPITRGSDQEYLREQFHAPTKGLLTPNGATESAVQALASAREAKKAAEEQEELAKARVMALLGEHQGVHTTYGKVSWGTVKGRAKTDWETIATVMGTPPELIQQHTTIGAPTRQFRFTPAKD